MGPLPSVVLIPILTYSLYNKHLYPSNLGETTVVLAPGAHVPEVKLEEYKRGPSDTVQPYIVLSFSWNFHQEILNTGRVWYLILWYQVSMNL